MRFVEDPREITTYGRESNAPRRAQKAWWEPVRSAKGQAGRDKPAPTHGFMARPQRNPGRVQARSNDSAVPQLAEDAAWPRPGPKETMESVAIQLLQRAVGRARSPRTYRSFRRQDLLASRKTKLAFATYCAAPTASVSNAAPAPHLSWGCCLRARVAAYLFATITDGGKPRDKLRRASGRWRTPCNAWASAGIRKARNT